MPTRRKQKQSLGKFRSKLEADVGEVLECYGFVYEPLKLSYHVPRNYTPDFVWMDLIVEVKGYFRAGDTQKYKAIRDSLPLNTLVFLLQSPGKKIRKGAKMTMAEWCEANEIDWFHVEDLDGFLDWVADQYDLTYEEGEEEGEDDDDDA